MVPEKDNFIFKINYLRSIQYFNANVEAILP